VTVVAPSGAGKSSLLRAGLLPKVAAGGFTPAGSRHWPRVVFTPGTHPMREAAAALLAVVPCLASREEYRSPDWAPDLEPVSGFEPLCV